jgi:hypothetical protein
MRNLSYFRGGWFDGKLIKTSEFWRTANGNFLDITVSEWWKLFADPSGKHHWRKVVSNQPAFEVGLLAALHISQAEFDEYLKEMRTYRDKFIAHLDDLETMQIPKLDIARGSLIYLYDFMLQHEDGGAYFNGLPPNASDYIVQSEAEVKEVNK